MPKSLPPVLACLILALLSAPAIAQDVTAAFDQDHFKEGAKWREVGPYRGGRSCAVAGIPDQRNVYYFGAAGGGVWKTMDAGRSWKNVSDGFFGGSIGSVAVSEWDPNVVYVGGGEKTVRGNVSHGDGMWRSTDAGKTWSHVGLDDSRHICRIRIHPRDPDLVYAAALGHLYGPNEQRGVYRSEDGGKSWRRVHFVDENVGCVDLVMDPTNPRILYATFWRVKRTPYSLESGGEGSGIWKTTDGGDTWKELTGNPGLPKPPVGIAGISVSRSNPENLYAIIEAEKGGVFRSKDGGETWRRTNQERSLRQRAWYYTRIYADPQNEEAVYVLNVGFHRSVDGGRKFSRISVPHGDNHDLWIDPADPLRMIQSNDGGANVSFDGGKTWSPQDNQPTAQMYRVSTDDAFPYRLLGGQQDNSAVRIRSRSAFGSAIGMRDWEPTAGGESGHIVAQPGNPDLVFGGSYGGYLTMVNHQTGERRSVNVWPDNPMGWGAAELEYRFQWNFPLFFSPHDPELLYAAGNVLFKSRDRGASWEAISPDLTRDDKSKQGPSGGPITKDNTSVEYYCTIFAALESPHEAGVLWAGSDDGLIHVSRDGGKNWSDVTPKGMPQWSQINSIEAHPSEPGGLYVAATRHKLDDFAPYLYRTTDWGKTWARIDAGIPRDHFTRVVRADPGRKGLLYAGTERGVYISFDDGAAWKPLQLELPVVPITDLAVKNGDLVAATQGRGYWILDDLDFLHTFAPGQLETAAHLFAPRPGLRLSGGRRPSPRNMGTNPPAGVTFSYLLKEEPGKDTKLELELLEEDGTVIRNFVRKPAPGSGSEEQSDGGRRNRGENNKLLPAKKGLNRFSWNLRYPGAKRFPGMILWSGGTSGPLAVPGRYQARLTVGDWSATVPFAVAKDPRSSATEKDFREQFAFLAGVRDKLSETNQEIGRIRAIKKQVKDLSGRLPDTDAAKTVRDAAKGLKEKLTGVEEALYQTKNKSRQDPLNFPIRLNDKLAGLMSVAGRGDFAPTAQLKTVRTRLTNAIDTQLETLSVIWSEDLPAFNRLAKEHAVPALILDEEKTAEQ